MNAPMRRAWTPEDETLLLELCETNMTWAGMAKILGREKSSVGSKIYELRSGAHSWRGGQGKQFHASFQIPTKRRNDDLAHCRAVMRANNGYGFPVGGGR